MTKPIIVVKICYKLLYVIQAVKGFLISDFLASTDIKVFGRTYLFAMLLLIGLALFLHPGRFCLAYIMSYSKSTLSIYQLYFTSNDQLIYTTT